MQTIASPWFGYMSLCQNCPSDVLGCVSSCFRNRSAASWYFASPVVLYLWSTSWRRLMLICKYSRDMVGIRPTDIRRSAQLSTDQVGSSRNCATRHDPSRQFTPPYSPTFLLSHSEANDSLIPSPNRSIIRHIPIHTCLDIVEIALIPRPLIQ